MGQPQEEAELQPLTADDETIIADLLRRLENREESTQPAENTERSEGKESKETKS